MTYENLRKGRYSESGRAYFITTVTKERETVFCDFVCARILINVMKGLDESKVVNNLSWVVMPDHLHWLFQLGKAKELSQVVKVLKAVSSRRINFYMNRQGSLWQKAFYDRAIRDDEDLQKLSRYIVANPLRAGIVNNIGEYSHWDAICL